MDVPATRIGEPHEPAEEARRAAVVREELRERRDVLVDPSVREEPEADRVEGILGEAEEVRVDLVRAGDLGQVEMGFPVDGRLGGGSETGRAPDEARPDDCDQRYDVRVVPTQILSFSLPSLYGQDDALEVDAIDLANSACTFEPWPLNLFLKPAVWMILATFFLSTERSAMT